MKLINQIKNISSKLNGKISFNEKLSKFSWFNIGGPGEVLFRPKNLRELSIFLKEIKGTKKIKILGAGSNTLIRDGGLDGIIIKFGEPFSRLSILDSNTIIAGSSALDKQVSNFALQNSLSGFEFLSCIPGTIGGAIRMNSGCYGDDISKILVSLQAMDFDGNIRVINSSDIKFFYRGSSLEDNLIFLSATFKGKREDKINISKRMNSFISMKKSTQPTRIKTRRSAESATTGENEGIRARECKRRKSR